MEYFRKLNDFRKQNWKNDHLFRQIALYILYSIEQKVTIKLLVSILLQNASAFDLKRKCVWLETQGRLTWNASAFWFEHKGVLKDKKNGPPGRKKDKSWRVVGVGRHFYKVYIRGVWNKCVILIPHLYIESLKNRWQPVNPSRKCLERA